MKAWFSKSGFRVKHLIATVIQYEPGPGLWDSFVHDRKVVVEAR